MKKLTILIAVLLLFSCEKPKDEPTVDPNKGTVTFWTTEESIIIETFPIFWQEGWLLWVDNVKIGIIKKPYDVGRDDQIPNCNTQGFTRLLLMKGQHDYYMTLSLPLQQPGQNYFVSQTYNFTVYAGGCTVVRCTQ